jgi:hypothetical protein
MGTSDTDFLETFDDHADEALANARERFPTFPRVCGSNLPGYGWGGSITADHESVTVHLTQGWRQAADLELDTDQARRLGEQLLNATARNDRPRASDGN